MTQALGKYCESLRTAFALFDAMRYVGRYVSYGLVRKLLIIKSMDLTYIYENNFEENGKVSTI